MSDFPEIDAAREIVAITAEAKESIGLISWEGHIRPVLDEHFTFKAKSAWAIRFMELVAHEITSPIYKDNSKGLTLAIASHISVLMWFCKAKPRELSKIPWP